METMRKLTEIETGVCSSARIEKAKLIAGNSSSVVVIVGLSGRALGYARVFGEAVTVFSKKRLLN